MAQASHCSHSPKMKSSSCSEKSASTVKSVRTFPLASVCWLTNFWMCYTIFRACLPSGISLSGGSQSLTMKAEHRWRLNRIIYLVIFGIGMVAAYLLPLLPYRMPMCLFKLITGYPCAGCGMTRAVVEAAHGHFLKAFEWHPLGLAFFIGVWSVVFVFSYELLTNKPLAWDLWLKRWGVVLAWVAFFAFLLLWLLRISYIHWGQWLPIPLRAPL